MNTDTSAKAAAPQDEPEDQQDGAKQENPGEKAAPEATDTRVAELEAKAQDAEKKYLYLYAEFENFRRRNERERIDFLKFGHESFLRELLQVLDNFERAIAHAKSMQAEKGSPLAVVNQGVEMIHYQLMETLKSQGVTSISPVGQKFDPAFHEAVGEEESDLEPGTVVKEMQKGYLLHNRLLRAAKVTIAKKK